MKRDKGRVEFESNDPILERGFYWAKAMALSYEHSGDAVGKWYDASLPGREAFCIRDVAHYSVGAQVLGLEEHNKNMLIKFAENISEARDYCSFWEISKDNLPVRGDYTNDKDFWYNLPANFDIVQACWKLFKWTNDHDYLHLPELNQFYNLTVHEFIKAWDKTGDGFPKRTTPASRRGIPSYEERDDYQDSLLMSDLIALQALAFESYANIHNMKGNDNLYREFSQKATDIRRYFNKEWWNEKEEKFHTIMLENNKLVTLSDDEQDLDILPLYYALITDGDKLEKQLTRIKNCDSQFVEYLSYLPELFYRYGLKNEAYQCLLMLTSPSLKRREYPEISFSVVGAMAIGLMGIVPNASRRIVETYTNLCEPVGYAKMSNIPLFSGEITLSNENNKTLVITNKTNESILWKPMFSGDYAEIIVNGEALEAKKTTDTLGKIFSFVAVPVENWHPFKAEICIEKEK